MTNSPGRPNGKTHPDLLPCLAEGCKEARKPGLQRCPLHHRQQMNDYRKRQYFEKVLRELGLWQS